MKKFNLNTFVMKTLESMKNGGEDEYKIMQYALKYYEKDVLTEEDMEKVQSWFEEPEEQPEDSENQIKDSDSKNQEVTEESSKK